MTLRLAPGRPVFRGPGKLVATLSGPLARGGLYFAPGERPRWREMSDVSGSRTVTRRSGSPSGGVAQHGLLVPRLRARVCELSGCGGEDGVDQRAGERRQDNRDEICDNAHAGARSLALEQVTAEATLKRTVDENPETRARGRASSP